MLLVVNFVKEFRDLMLYIALKMAALFAIVRHVNIVKVKVKFILEQATTVQRRSIGMGILYL
jgi:hypothetical protein